jgi:hypothetical protein
MNGGKSIFIFNNVKELYFLLSFDVIQKSGIALVFIWETMVPDLGWNIGYFGSGYLVRFIAIAKPAEYYFFIIGGVGLSP